MSQTLNEKPTELDTIQKMAADLLDRLQVVRFMNKKMATMNAVVIEYARLNGVNLDDLDVRIQEFADAKDHQAYVEYCVRQSIAKATEVSQQIEANEAQLNNFKRISDRARANNNNRNTLINEKARRYNNQLDTYFAEIKDRLDQIDSDIEQAVDDNSRAELTKAVNRLERHVRDIKHASDEQFELRIRRIQSYNNAINTISILVKSYSEELKQLNAYGSQMSRRLDALSDKLLDATPEGSIQADDDVLSLFDSYSSKGYQPRSLAPNIDDNKQIEPDVNKHGEFVDDSSVEIKPEQPHISRVEQNETQTPAPKKKKHGWMFWKK